LIDKKVEAKPVEEKLNSTIKPILVNNSKIAKE
jgi:hypothetical protein